MPAIMLSNSEPRRCQLGSTRFPLKTLGHALPNTFSTFNNQGSHVAPEGELVKR